MLSPVLPSPVRPYCPSGLVACLLGQLSVASLVVDCLFTFPPTELGTGGFRERLLSKSSAPPPLWSLSLPQGHPSLSHSCLAAPVPRGPHYPGTFPFRILVGSDLNSCWAGTGWTCPRAKMHGKLDAQGQSLQEAGEEPEVGPCARKWGASGCCH